MSFYSKSLILLAHNGQRYVLVGGNGFQTVMAHAFTRSISDRDLSTVTLSVIFIAVLVSFQLLRYFFFGDLPTVKAVMQKLWHSLLNILHTSTRHFLNKLSSWLYRFMPSLGLLALLETTNPSSLTIQY